MGLRVSTHTHTHTSKKRTRTSLIAGEFPEQKSAFFNKKSRNEKKKKEKYKRIKI